MHLRMRSSPSLAVPLLSFLVCSLASTIPSNISLFAPTRPNDPTPLCYTVPSFRYTVNSNTCAASLAWFLADHQRPHDKHLFHGSHGKIYFPPLDTLARDQKCILSLYAEQPEATLSISYMRLWVMANEVISWCSGQGHGQDMLPRKGRMGGKMRMFSVINHNEKIFSGFWLTVKGRKVFELGTLEDVAERTEEPSALREEH